METPRKGLIRATERAIREYIQDSCERNLSLIEKLEDASYNIWVESNTDFLHHDLFIDGCDDEGYMWDDDITLSSFTYTRLTTNNRNIETTSTSDENCHDVTLLSDDLNDDVDLPTDDDLDLSSTGSSVRACDETDCWLGYQAGSEGESDIDMEQQAHIYRTLCEHYTSGENNYSDVEVVKQEHMGIGALDSQRRLTRSMRRQLTSVGNNIENGMNTSIQNDWIVLNSDLIEDTYTLSRASATPNVSNFLVSNTVSETSAKRKYISEINDDIRFGSEEYTNELDQDEWSVLSMNITEHVYPAIKRRKLFPDNESDVNENKCVPIYCRSNVLSYYLDSIEARLATRWPLIRLVLRLFRILLHI